MRKFLSLLILPLIAIFCFVGCGEDRTIEDVENLYKSMTEVYVNEDNNLLFSNKDKPNTITIKYSTLVSNAVNITTPSTDMQKRYSALGYQQQILNYIFNYYEQNQEDFYRILKSKEINNSDINDLYERISGLKTSLENFKAQYDIFTDSTNSGISDVMEFNLTSYTYEVNKIIDSSFNFIYKFIDMYNNYCIENADALTAKNLSLKIQRTYVDIANIVYLENFKAFNYSVGTNGICDLAPVINTSNNYSLIEYLEGDVKSISNIITEGLIEDSKNHNYVLNLINDFVYSEEVFSQRLNSYKAVYNEQDIYTLTQHRFGLVSGVDYTSYLDSLSTSNRANIYMFEEFVNTNFIDLVDNLNTIIA